VSLFKAASTVSLLTLASRVTGLVRDLLMAATFGASALTDAFNVAFRIPNLFRRLFAEGAFSQAFVPALAHVKERDGEAATHALVDHVATALAWALVATCVVGVAGAPVLVWLLYDTHYTERYMGDPREVPQAYATANAMADSAKISDPLLLIHGMADDNVVFEHSSALIAKLQGEAVPFEMMLYPGYTHRISGPKVSQHLYETIFRFLDRNGAGSGK